MVDGSYLVKGKSLIVMEAHIQHDDRALNKFIEAFNRGADLMVGQRKADGGSEERQSVIRKFVSWSATKLAHIILQLPVTDRMRGFLRISRALQKQVTPLVNPTIFKNPKDILHARSKGVGS